MWQFDAMVLEQYSQIPIDTASLQRQRRQQQHRQHCARKIFYHIYVIGIINEMLSNKIYPKNRHGSSTLQTDLEHLFSMCALLILTVPHELKEEFQRLNLCMYERTRARVCLLDGLTERIEYI